jgi:hypothetical protein
MTHEQLPSYLLVQGELEEDMTHRIAGILAAFMIAGAVLPADAGCLKGAVVGAVAGHYAHHHAVLGAMAGCAIGHHLTVKAREQKAADQKAAAAKAAAAASASHH